MTRKEIAERIKKSSSKVLKVIFFRELVYLVVDDVEEDMIPEIDQKAVEYLLDNCIGIVNVKSYTAEEEEFCERGDVY